MSRIGNALGIRPEESQRLIILIISSFFLGIALVLYYTASNAIFLTVYEISALPYMYILNAVITIAFGALYALLEKRISFTQLLYATNAALALPIFLFWLGFQATDTGAVAFIAMAWYRLLFIFTTLGLWELASAVFNVRQAKRLFTLIGLGLMAAFILGGLSASTIVSAVGTVNLLLIAAVCLFIYTGALIGLLPRLNLQSTRAVQPEAGEDSSLWGMFQDRYVVLIFVLKIVGMLTGYVVEYIFYRQAAVRYPNEEALADFLGDYTAIMTLGMVVMAVVAGRYISRYGIKIGLSTTPVSILATATAGALYGTLIGLQGIFFALVASVMFANQVLSWAIHNPTFAILYQPLSRTKRLKVRVAVEGWLGSVALMMSGVLLIIFGLLPVTNVAPFLYLVVGLGCVFLAVALFTYRRYGQQLQHAVTARFVSGVALPDGQSLDDDFLAGLLQSNHPGKIIAGLNYLETIQDNAAAPFLLDLLQHPSDDIRLDVLRRIEEARYRQALDEVERLAHSDEESPRLRGQAFITWLALKDDKTLAEHMDMSDKYVLVGVLRYGNPAAVYDPLRRLTQSENPDERIQAAFVLSETTRGDFNELLIALLRDKVRSVWRAAIKAAENRMHSALWEPLLDLLPSPLAADVLSQAGDEIIVVLQARFAGLSTEGQRAALHIYGKLGTQQAVKLLSEFLQMDASFKLYQAALRALRGARYHMEDAERIIQLIRREAAIAAQLLRDQQETTHDLLQRALESELDRVRRRIFHLLPLLYDPDKIRDVEYHLAYEEKRANAIEVLDIMLTKELKDLVFPLLEEMPAETRLARLPREPQILSQDYLNAWTKLCADYARAKHELETDMLTLIEKVMLLRSAGIFSQTPDAILAEVAEALREHHVQKDETLIEKGAIGSQMYLITSGAVRVHDGELTIRTLSDGDIVGELAVLDPAPRAATVTAAADTHLFVLDQDVLYDLMDTRSEVAQNIIGILARRVRSQTVLEST